jgi:hypothetical protein
VEDFPSGQIVTATDLVRHFAAHARRAQHEPVHIMNHGNIGLSLISTEMFRRLSGGHVQVHDDNRLAAKLDVLIDLISTQAILFDKDLKLLRINLAARRRIEVSEEDARALPLSQILEGTVHNFSMRALERVRDTGVPEVFEISPPDQPSMVYSVRILPLISGFVLLADEIVDKVALREKGARSGAYESLIDNAPGLARGTFNIRGVVTQISAGLCRLLHSDESRIIGVRFASLFDASHRVAVGDAIEGLLTSGKPFSLAASLLGSSAPDKTVWVNAAPLHSADGQAGGVFLIASS